MSQYENVVNLFGSGTEEPEPGTSYTPEDCMDNDEFATDLALELNKLAYGSVVDLNYPGVREVAFEMRNIRDHIRTQRTGGTSLDDTLYE